jgi:NAD(P)-dependent dehydrogenase (short-subunit alcohol dehydrogenase family)
MNQASVKAFAQAILKRPGGLHILVNNAGLGYCKKSFTEDGVGMLTQVSVFRNCATPHSNVKPYNTGKSKVQAVTERECSCLACPGCVRSSS